MNSCGVILSGGKSSRMGKNKSLLMLNNKPVIEHIKEELRHCCKELIIVANEPAVYSFLEIPIVGDRYKEKGPLAGIETALYHRIADIYLITACDTPFISQQVYSYLVTQLVDNDAVVPVYQGKMHPLSGIYKKTVLPMIQHQLNNDERKVRHLFKHISVNYVHNFGQIEDGLLQKHFFNMNDQVQYEQAKRV